MTDPQISWETVLAALFERYAIMARESFELLAGRVDPDLAARTLALAEYAPAQLDCIDEGKANRWLGFIQGVVIAGGLTTVQAERDFTRPLFHALKGASASHEAMPPL